MKLAAFTVMLPDLTPDVAAHELKAAGYDGVEWRVTRVPEGVRNDPPSFWGNNHCTFPPTEDAAERARALSQEAGLETPNIGTCIGLGELDKVRAAINFAKVLGSPNFRVGFGDFEGDYARHFADATAFLGEVISLAQKAGLKPLVEIHHRTIVPSASLAHRLVSQLASSEVGVIHDLGNMAREGFEDYLLGLELDARSTADRTYNSEELNFIEESVTRKDRFNDDLVLLYKDLYATLRENKPLAITPESVRRQIRMFEKCRASAGWV